MVGWRTVRAAVAVSALAVTSGCGDDAGGEGETEGSGPSTDASTGDSSGADEPSEPAPGEEDAGSLASDIAVLRVEVNQGSAIAVVDDGVLLEPTEHVELVPGRPGVLRVYWQTEPSFEARDIEARLLLLDAAGERTLSRQVLSIAGPPDASSLDGTFTFALDETTLAEGMAFSVGLFEVGGTSSGASESGARVPAQGQAELGVATGPMTLRVMLVPVTPPGDPGLPISEEERETLALRLHERFPTSSVEVTVRDPMPHPSVIGDVAEVLDPLIEQRVADIQAGLEGADWDVYYHAVLNLDACCTEGVSGGYGLTDVGGGKGETRVSSSAAHPGDFVRDGWLVAHEIGHNHGISHAPCGVGDSDPQYPHADALLGAQGYDITTGALIDAASTHDLMSYCSPSWSSDYAWEKFTRRVRTLNSWANESSAPPPSPRAAGVGVACPQHSRRSP